MKNETGFIYILTNESFHRSNWVKIGYATDVEKRVKELSNTSVPLPYEVYATYEVPLSEMMPDKAFHTLIQKLNPSLRLSPNREFFEIEPWDAYELLESMAIIHNRLDKLVRHTDNQIGPDFGETKKGSYSIESLFGDTGKARALFERILSLTKEVVGDFQTQPLKNYVAIKQDGKHNLISLWPKVDSIEVVLNAKVGQINDDSGMVYDISNRLWTAAQYAFRFDDSTDNELVKSLIQQTANLKNGRAGKKMSF